MWASTTNPNPTPDPDPNPNQVRVGLDDGTTICASHIVAADGKWSVVRAAFFEDWCAPPSWMLYLLWRYSLWRYSLRLY